MRIWLDGWFYLVGIVFALFLVGVTDLPAASKADIRSTKHNLSVSGPGSVKATTETEICIFCGNPPEK